jgi:hypothetical protein
MNVEDNIPNVGDNVRNVGDNVRIVGDNVRIVGDNVRIVGDNVHIVGDNVRIVGDKFGGFIANLSTIDGIRSETFMHESWQLAVGRWQERPAASANGQQPTAN